MDFDARWRSALLNAYREERLHLDGLISCARLVGVSSEEIVMLLEDASETEPGSSRNAKLASLFLCGYMQRRLGVQEIVVWAIEAGFADHEVTRLLDRMVDGLDGLAA